MSVKPEDVRFMNNSRTQEQEIARIREENAETIAALEASLAKARDSLQTKIDEVAIAAELTANIRNAGIAFNPTAADSLVLKVKIEDLPALYEVVGKLKVNGKSIAHEWDRPKDGKDYVVVYLESVRYPDLLIYYVKPLTPDSKCKIVRETKTETHMALVCSI